jgi:predicted ATPase
MAKIEQLEVKNYKVLADFKLGQAVSAENSTPINLALLSVFLGPNGSGKSTLFDLFGFLAQCLQTNVNDALAQRGGFEEVRSRKQHGDISITLKYREQENDPLMTYELQIGQERGRAIVKKERLAWRRGQTGGVFHFLDFENGRGFAITGEDENEDSRTKQALDRPDILALKGLGQFSNFPRIANLRRFIEGWFLSYFVPKQGREMPDLGYAPHLSREGENLSNYTRYLCYHHPDIFESILEKLSRRIPGLEKVDAQASADGRVLLRFKDAAFDDAFVARFVSDGTIKMFAYLALLNDPDPPSLLCLEEPENGLHPQLLGILVEEFRQYSQQTQIFISSHSPALVNHVDPRELWLMNRDLRTGYARVYWAKKAPGLENFLSEGLPLGDLWVQNHLGEEVS